MMQMAFSFSPKFLFAISLLSLTASCCKAQQADSVQIVARAALCFDNQTVTNNCSRWMGRISNRNGTGAQNGSTTTNGFCNSPCFGQMMLVLNCMEGLFSNFQSYSPGLMQGVQSIFQMSCGGSANINNNASPSGNMVAGPIEERAQAFKPEYMMTSLWIFLLAFALVAALILCFTKGFLVHFS